MQPAVDRGESLRVRDTLEQLLRRNVKRLRGGLVFKVHSLLYHSTLGPGVIRKKKAAIPLQPAVHRGESLRVRDGSGFRVQGAGFRVQGAGFRVQGSGLRVQGSGLSRKDERVGA